MKSNKPNKSIGKLADQEVNTDQVKGGSGFVPESIKSVKHAKPGKHTKNPTGLPGQTSDTAHSEQLKK